LLLEAAKGIPPRVDPNIPRASDRQSSIAQANVP
jgi:hypothetical protein